MGTSPSSDIQVLPGPRGSLAVIINISDVLFLNPCLVRNEKFTQVSTGHGLHNSNLYTSREKIISTGETLHFSLKLTLAILWLIAGHATEHPVF